MRMGAQQSSPVDNDEQQQQQEQYQRQQQQQSSHRPAAAAATTASHSSSTMAQRAFPPPTSSSTSTAAPAPAPPPPAQLISNNYATLAPPPPLPAPKDTAPPTAKSDAGSTRSRRGSFSFLRRSKSRDEASFKRQPSDGKSSTNKLSKSARKKQAASDQKAAAAAAAQSQQQQQQQVPRLPSQLLPQLEVGALSSHPAQGPGDLRQSPPSSYQRPGNAAPITSYPPSSYSQTSVRTAPGSYVPGAFYQRHVMDQSAPPMAGSSPNVATGDSHSRNESMTNRGRYSYGSFASSAPGGLNSPRRMRRRRDPTPFNILVLGTKNCGKTSFIDFLRTALARPINSRYASTSPPPSATPRNEINPSFSSHYLETELDGERIGLTLYDSKGLERHIVDLQLREISSFLESKFQETFNEEQKVMRATGVRDTHIHCVFLILDPSRLDVNVASSKGAVSGERLADPPRVVGGLDERLDVNLLHTLQGKTTVIPVISKADTVITAHMSALKRIVWDSFKKIKFDPLEALSGDDDESDYATAAGSTIQDTDDEDGSSSTYGDSRHGDGVDRLTNKTQQTHLGGTPEVRVDGAPDMPISATAPQHPDIRLSTLSDNVDLPYLPMSIISPDVYEPGVIGRRFPWGFADPYNADHCDFVKLKDSVFSEWRVELRQAARERWYENWRTSRLKRRGHQATAVGTAASPRSPVGGRAVSGAAAYGVVQAVHPPPTGRVVSTSQIGVAISNGYDDSSSAATSQHHR